MARDYMGNTRICIDCGKVLNHCGNAKKRCDSCGKAHIRKYKRENAHSDYWDKKLGRPKNRKPLSMHQKMQAANQSGMSYGMYQAMIYAQEG